ncbi:hypothetical protein PybrP1_009988 [[Pythium] brassicae (nom. inval.)]|nr:hypothetical protein PybrP1_009988 [[Pythium] brassicae (nom. inval.)]
MADADPLDAYMATLAVATNDNVPSAWPAVRPRAARTSTQTRNRRFRRLQQLLADGDDEHGNSGGAYFSDAMMQQRSPALFHFHLGQYLPAAAAAAASVDPNASSVDEQLLLSTFLLRASDRGEMEARRAWEQRAWGAFVGRDEVDARRREKSLFQRDDVEEEEEDSSDADEVNSEKDEGKESEERDAATSVDERRRILVDLMAHRFLHGSDHEFVDYAAIDGDAALDDLEQIQRDAEDAYFDRMDEED